MPSPETPSVIFLDNLRKVETRVCERRDPFFQPRRKVLPKTGGINEVWLHFPMLKLVSFNRDRLIHVGLRLFCVGESMASLRPAQDCHSERSEESAFSSLLRVLCALCVLCVKFSFLSPSRPSSFFPAFSNFPNFSASFCSIIRYRPRGIPSTDSGPNPLRFNFSSGCFSLNSTRRNSSFFVSLIRTSYQ